MGRCLPIVVSPPERLQLEAWSSSHTGDPRLKKDSYIILALGDGTSTGQVSRESNLSRQSVTELKTRFIVFGLDGIRYTVPRAGRPYAIQGTQAEEILSMPLYAEPIRGRHWTGIQLASHCKASASTTYRFLSRHHINLRRPIPVRTGTIINRQHIEELRAIYLSSRISVVAFQSRNDEDIQRREDDGHPMSPPSNREPSILFANERRDLCSLLQRINHEFLPRPIGPRDIRFLKLFLRILPEKVGAQRDVLLIANMLENELPSEVRRWTEGRGNLHFIAPPSYDGWVRLVRTHLDALDARDARIVANQMEGMRLRLLDWMAGPYKCLGLCAIFVPAWKEVLRGLCTGRRS